MTTLCLGMEGSIDVRCAAEMARLTNRRHHTHTLDTAFLSPARAEDFDCKATVLRWGRRLVYGTAECRNLEGKLLTHHTLNYVRQ